MWLSKTSKCLSFGFFSPILVLLCSYISSLRIWIVVWSSRTLERELSMAGVGTEEKWVGSANTVVKRFAPARRQCSQLKKRAGNYRVVYMWARESHTIFHITRTPLKRSWLHCQHGNIFWNTPFIVLIPLFASTAHVLVDTLLSSRPKIVNN